MYILTSFSRRFVLVLSVAEAGWPTQLRLPHPFDYAQGRLFAVFEGWEAMPEI